MTNLPTGSGIATLLGNGDCTFRAGPVASVFDAGALTAVDLNGDGRADLVNTVCCGESDATYLIGNGDGSFQDEQHIVAGPSRVGVTVADFDGDGKADLAFAGRFGGYVTPLYNSFPDLTVASAANVESLLTAPESIAMAIGPRLATGPAKSDSAPTELAGTSVTVRDADGVERLAPLFSVTPGHVSFEVPAGTVAGVGAVTVTASDGRSTRVDVRFADVAPGMSR